MTNNNRSLDDKVTTSYTLDHSVMDQVNQLARLTKRSKSCTANALLKIALKTNPSIQELNDNA